MVMVIIPKNDIITKYIIGQLRSYMAGLLFFFQFELRPYLFLTYRHTPYFINTFLHDKACSLARSCG